MLDPLLLYKNENILHKNYKLIAGVDEAGRGPLAGPVVIAAVILNFKTKPMIGLNDSKKVSAVNRERLFHEIKKNALAYSIIEISHQRIDEINILEAVMEGMKHATDSLTVKPDLCLIDGNKIPDDINCKSLACIQGDAIYASIAAASILAKVHRDVIMTELDAIYPEYGFARHKGYPTQQHIRALSENGPCPIHRLTFAPLLQSINMHR